MGALVSSPEIIGLGAIAGFTIYLGLPIGRLRNPAPRLQSLLNAVAIGILVFLLFDVLSHANEPVETALTRASDGVGSWWRFAGLAAIFAAGVGVGLLTLVYYDAWSVRRRRRVTPYGPGAMAIGELRDLDVAPRQGLSAAQRLALVIALGIGLHNFSEGLAIGQSAAKGEIGLALLLIIGFGLHNATEGFGIVAPLAAERERASWGFLALMGLIGGGPTFLGTIVGYSFVSAPLAVLFLALAAGAILYVMGELFHVARNDGMKHIAMLGLLVGFLMAFATELVLQIAGA